jgi:cytochrome c-type biogenesis protein CcmH/NrfG
VSATGTEGLRFVAEKEAEVQGRPAEGAAWFELACAYQAEGQADLALVAFRRAVALDPDAWHWLGLSEALADLDEASESLDAARRAFERAPDQFPVLLHLGRALLRSGRPREARPYLEEAHRRRPRDARPIGLLGVAHFRCDDFAAAIGPLEESLRREPDDPVRWAYLGASLDETGRVEAAVWALESAVHARPDYAWAWGRLGKALRATGHHEAAVRAFGRSVEHGFAPPVLWADMGHSAAELRDVPTVRRACRELGRLAEPDLARALRARLRRIRAEDRAAGRSPSPPAAPDAPGCRGGRRAGGLPEGVD